jgi:hypothetical protein
MSGIGGSKRERKEGGSEFPKKVGLFEASVIAINPTIEQYKDILGIELKEDSKSTEYLGESKDGNSTVRISVWLKDVKSGQNFNINYYLEDKERENKDGTKKQYINQLGLCAWAADEDGLPQWFKGTAGNEKDFRVAYVGEEEFYEFLRNWLCELDYSRNDTTLSLDWKKLIRGNVREISSQVNGEYCGNFVAMATITTREKDGEVKEYQNVYNKAFLPAYSMKQFRLKENDYNDSSRVSSLLSKKSKDLRPHERFVVKIAGEYGCKDYYTFKDLHEYDPETNIVASNKVIANDDADY